jgi:hypothetical protein
MGLLAYGTAFDLSNVSCATEAAVWVVSGVAVFTLIFAVVSQVRKSP